MMKKAESFSTSRGERVSYGLFFFGGILGYYLIASFFQLYLTNTGIPAAAVGLIFIGAKVWDAVNDPIFGVIVDKAHFKKGKFLPWLRVAVITTPIATMLMFLIPMGVSLQIKILWATLSYILWDASSTLYDVPANALVTSI
jgi:Na+/melibiose symporter-like transporter